MDKNKCCPWVKNLSFFRVRSSPWSYSFYLANRYALPRIIFTYIWVQNTHTRTHAHTLLIFLCFTYFSLSDFGFCLFIIIFLPTLMFPIFSLSLSLSLSLTLVLSWCVCVCVFDFKLIYFIYLFIFFRCLCLSCYLSLFFYFI